MTVLIGLLLIVLSGAPLTEPPTVGVAGTGPTVAAVAVIPPLGRSSGVTGEASWFCKPGVSRCTAGYPASGPYAAAGPELRAVPGWRGRWVLVCAQRCIEARLVDYCACPGDRVIDLYASRFSELGPLSKGTIHVSVAFLAREDVRLPATDTEGSTP